MRLLIFLCLFCLSCPAAVLAEKSSLGRHYDATVQYSGPFDRAHVYEGGAKPLKKVPGLKVPRLKHLPCTEAADSLRSKGRWKGQLSSNGECQAADGPREYFGGNFLNYLFQHKGGLK